jgi:probable HAF family extracellular repeat protein
MGVLTGGNYSEARAVNDSDQAAGEATTSGGETHAFFWDSSGGMIDLGTLGGASSRANGISPAGEVVGESTISSGTLRAFAWTERDGAMTLIDLNEFLPAESGWTLRRAWSINASSEIAGEGKRNAFLLQPVVP